MLERLTKNQINFLIIFIGFSILVGFGLAVKSMFYEYAIQTNVDKARVVTQELLATRHYLAQIAPHTKIINPSINHFANSPAFVGSQIGATLEKKGYIYLKQTSLRYRNPNNAPDKFEQSTLKKYENNSLQNEHYEVSKMNNKDFLRYSYPLYIKKACLSCHGKPYTDVKKETYEQLVKNYGDKSFNYKLGDLRGMISVAIDMQSIEDTLSNVKQKMFLGLFILFIVILIFFYLENILIYNPQIKKYQELNSTLESKINKEVEKNRKQDQQLIEQSRLAQMGEMISMIAHQWRQPLNAISITTNTLQLKIMLNEISNDEFSKEIKKINEYSQHLSSTIDDFRNFFKNKKEKVETNLETIVNSTLNIVGKSLENHNITLKTNLAYTYVFKTYENEIKQVVLNLIKNAEDALIENNVDNPCIEIINSCGIDGNTPTLIIKDNAGGIPTNIISKIFNPYFSTKTKKDGTGLGLYMSKTIIEEHCHGKLSAYNENGGAVFKIEFTSQKIK